MQPTLQLKLSQQLTMTPQLQQAIKLLQLSCNDLSREIQEVVETNPMLEYAEENCEPKNPIDKFYNTKNIYPERNIDSDDNLEHIFGNSENNLSQHLLWQLNLSHFSETEIAIATTVIDAIDDEGYLRANISDIRQSLQTNTPITDEDIKTVINKVQQFDPIGVGASSLAECLSIQLQVFAADSPLLAPALNLVNNYLTLLGKNDQIKLCQKLKLSRDELQSIIKIIKSLNPKPGLSITPSKSEFIIPDVFVKKVGNRWQVKLNDSYIPKIKVNEDYASLVKRADSSADNQFMQKSITEARWFLKSLENRNDTLYKVANAIVLRQHKFLEHGDIAMKPLVLHDIAREIDMHESTVSRVTTRKYMHTPRGIFELKYFFSSLLSAGEGEDYSSVAIRAIIKEIISAESKLKPLSDNKIVEVLASRGIKVARRTIAKYREAMTIPSSSERKMLA